MQVGSLSITPCLMLYSRVISSDNSRHKEPQHTIVSENAVAENTGAGNTQLGMLNSFLEGLRFRYSGF